MKAWSRRASWAWMLETMAPPWKMGHVAAGPMKRERLEPLNQVLTGCSASLRRR